MIEQSHDVLARPERDGVPTASQAGWANVPGLFGVARQFGARVAVASASALRTPATS